MADWEWIAKDEQVPPDAVFALRLTDDTMEPALPNGSTVYVDLHPVTAGEVGIFLLEGQALCRQYYRDPLGMVYLFTLNRRRASEDRLVPPGKIGGLVCLGRVLLPPQPLPGWE